MTTPVVCGSVALARRAAVSACSGLAVVLAAACASRGDPSPAALAPLPTSRAARDVLTGEEVRAHAGRAVSLYDVVRDLRVGFLGTGADEPAVLIDGRYAGPATVPREIPVSRVREIRRVRGVDLPLVYGRRRRPGVVLDVILAR